MFEEMESFKGENIFYANMIHEFQKNVAIGLNKVQGSRKTRQYQQLSIMIPGFYGMDPRTQNDKAISCLINEMKEQNVNKTTVYTKAKASSDQASVGNLRRSFQILAPKINPDLVAIALKSFGGDEEKVEQTEFYAILDENFDKSLAQSKGSAKKSAVASKAASAV